MVGGAWGVRKKVEMKRKVWWEMRMWSGLLSVVGGDDRGVRQVEEGGDD